MRIYILQHNREAYVMGGSPHRIHRIELPVPFPVKTINAYLVEAEPITLVDTGIKTDESFHVLDDSLRKLGCGIKDIRRILITHGHIDHYGQAKRISTVSGAEIHIHRKDYERIQSTEQFRRSLVSVLMQNGTPKDSLDEAINYMRGAMQTLADPLDDVRFIEDGEKIPFENMVFQSIHCPGHSPGLLCFHLQKESILISGDHLLDEVSPNPIINLSQNGPGPRSTSLKEYLDSIRRIENLEVSLVLPGHGEPIQDFQGAVEQALHHHDQRLSMVLGVLSRGEMTAYEISSILFPKAKSFEVFLGVSEVLGHLRILLDDGRIVFRSRAGVDYYSTI